MLEALRRLLKERGRLSQDIVNGCDDVPSVDAYRKLLRNRRCVVNHLIGLTGDRYSMTYSRPRGLLNKGDAGVSSASSCVSRALSSSI